MQKRIEELEWELKYKEEQLEKAVKALRGTIEANGTISTVHSAKGWEGNKWEINVSSILTKLIQEVGRLCDRYASDLFIHWNEIQKKLDNGMYGDELYIFAIRDSGVDHAQWYENHKYEPNYYRAVWFLNVYTNDGQIKMVLHK